MKKPYTSSVTTVGSNFMGGYALSCSSLNTLLLPKVGYFLSNNIDWSVPSARLGILKGKVLDASDLSDWKGLVTSGKTLYTNYIRDADKVILFGSDSIIAIARRRLLLR